MLFQTSNGIGVESASDELKTSGDVLTWDAKLGRICHKIHVAKGAFVSKKLDDHQAGAAARLIRQIEHCVSHLGQCTARVAGQESVEGVPACDAIEGQLNNLNVLCEELLLAVSLPSRPSLS